MMPSAAPSVIFHEDVVLPTLDAKENPAKQCQVLGVFREDSDLRRRTEGNLIAGYIVDNLNLRQSSVTGGIGTVILKCARRLKLASCHGIQDMRDFSRKHLPRYRVERDLSGIAGLDSLQRVLLESAHEHLITFARVYEHHHRAQRGRNNVHSRPQGDLAYEARGWRMHNRLVEIELGVIQLRLQLRDTCIHAADIR